MPKRTESKSGDPKTNIEYRRNIFTGLGYPCEMVNKMRMQKTTATTTSRQSLSLRRTAPDKSSPRTAKERLPDTRESTIKILYQKQNEKKDIK